MKGYTHREVTQSTDDTSLVRETLTDGSKVWNVELKVDGGILVTIGCNDAHSARSLYGHLSQASFINVDAPHLSIEVQS